MRGKLQGAGPGEDSGHEDSQDEGAANEEDKEDDARAGRRKQRSVMFIVVTNMQV
jgi:hypothetical protein